MKKFSIIGLVLVVILVIIQFIPGGIPGNLPSDGQDISNSGIMTEDVAKILKTSCFDCHSNQTQFPWYSRLAPSSWFLADHIREGREHLNFSEWESYNTRKKIGQLVSIREEITEGKMPLRSYTLIHRDARLDQQEMALLEQWISETSEKILQ